MRLSILFCCLFSSLVFINTTQAQSRQKLNSHAIFEISTIGSPIIAPQGDWVLFTKSKADEQKDKNISGLFMISKDGAETISLTEQTKGVSNYNWSPDGKYISYLAAGKEEKEESQLFLLDRRGGESIQLTHIKGEIENYKWFKDGSKILFEIKDPNYADTAKTKVRHPYEIDRYHFKADHEGYLDNRKTHLY